MSYRQVQRRVDVGSRHDKQEQVAQLADKLGRATSVIFTDYRGLTVAELTDLRRRLRSAAVEYRVVKNTLARRALLQANLGDAESLLEGPTAIAFGYDDPVIPAQVLAAFSRDRKALQLKGGMVEGRLLTKAQVAVLADLPPLSELRAMLARGLRAPLMSLAIVLQAPLRGLARGLDAVRANKQDGAAA